MSQTSRKDALLVIRARDEASRATNAAAEAMVALNEAQRDLASGADLTGTKLQDIVLALKFLERANTSVSASWSKAESAYESQQRTLGETRAQLASVQGQIGQVAGAIEAAQRRIVDAVLEGADTSGFLAQIQAARTALGTLTSQQDRLTGSVAAQEKALGQSRNSLLQLGSIANATEATLIGVGDAAQRGMLEALAATERETEALREQARAAREAVAAQNAQGRFNSVLGVRDITPGSARASAEVLKEVQAREDLAISLREEAAAARGVVEQKERLAEIERLLGVRNDTTGQARESAEAFQEQIRAAEGVASAAREVGAAEQYMGEQAARLRERIDPLATIQNRLNVALKEARDLYRAGKISAEELARAEEFLANEANDAAQALERQGRGEKGKIGFLGLKPYEMTNLGYQINDVFTQLASGTSLTQTLAQQGGQILQLFPRVGAAIVAALGNPVILTAVAGFAAIAMAVVRLNNEAARLREFEGVLRTIGQDAGYTATALSDAADELDRYGMSAQEAVAAVRTFMREGINPERINEFGRAAQDMADVLGVDVADAVQQVTDGFTGGWDALMRLQEATGFLSTEERRHLQVMFERGQAQEALTQAFEIFRGRMDEGARRANGSWTRAARSVDNAWKNFLDRMATAPGQMGDWIRSWHSLGDVVDRVARLLGGMPTDALNVTPSTEVTEAAVQGLERQLASLRRMKEAAEAVGRDTRQIDGWIAEAETRIQELRASNPLTDPNSEANQRYLDETQRVLDLERQIREARTDAERTRLEGQRAYNEEMQRSHNEEVARLRQREAVEQSNIRDRRDILQNASRYIGRNENVAADRGVLQELFRAANINIDPRMVAWCAAFVNAVLATQGVQGTGSLSARSFLNFGTETNNPTAGDLVVLRRGRDERQGHVGFLTGFDRNGNPRIVSGNAGGGREVTEQTFNRSDVLGYRRIPTTGSEMNPVHLDERRAQNQAEFNRQLDLEIEQRRRVVEQQRGLLGLSGEQLHTEQRRQAVDDALYQARTNASQRDLELSEERRAAIEEIAGAEWDVANARERATAAVDEASAERQALIDRLMAAREAGENELAAQLETQLDRVNEALRQAVENAIRFWAQWDTPEARAAVMTLNGMREGIGRTSEDMTRGPLQQRMDQLVQQRSGLQERVDLLRNEGQIAQADQLREQIRALDQQLLQAIDRMIEFWSVSQRPEAAATLLSLQNLRNQIVAAGDEFRISAGEIQQAFAGSMVSSVTNWAQAIGEGRNALGATWDMLRGFAADFIQKLAQMALQALALRAAMKLGFGGAANAMSGLTSAAPLTAAAGTLAASGAVLTGAAGGLNVAGGALNAAGAVWTIVAARISAAAAQLAAAGATGGGEGGLGLMGLALGLFHRGGIAGAATQSRGMQAMTGFFQRYHTGGIAGFAPDEVGAILKRGEEILTRDDPRHRFNGWGAPAAEPKVDLKNVIMFDMDSAVSEALHSRVGERTLLSVIRRNSRAVRAALQD